MPFLLFMVFHSMRVNARRGDEVMKALKSVEQAATLLGISKWTVRSYIKVEKLKPVRIGRRVLLAEDELERFVGANREPVKANGNGNGEVRP